MSWGISVVIPSMKTRSDMLGGALASVYGQDLPCRQVCVAVDEEQQGAAATRQRALQLSVGEWVAFLDDDDVMLPNHLQELSRCARETNADYVFSWFVRAKGGDPLGHFGKPFNNAAPHHTTMTILCKRELALSVGFLSRDERDSVAQGVNSNEDWRFTLGCIEAGAKIVHHPVETWIWNRHRGNTSGLPSRSS